MISVDCPEKWHNMAQSRKDRFNLQAYFSASHSVFDIKSSSRLHADQIWRCGEKHSLLTRPVSFQGQGSVLQRVHKNKNKKTLGERHAATARHVKGASSRHLTRRQLNITQQRLLYQKYDSQNHLTTLWHFAAIFLPFMMPANPYWHDISASLWAPRQYTHVFHLTFNKHWPGRDQIKPQIKLNYFWYCKWVDI